MSMTDMELVRIDGSYGEGGGQILRTAIALSVITKKPIEVFNIRAKRPNPGLRPQHAATVKILAEIFNARVENVEVGSSIIRFMPMEADGTSINSNRNRKKRMDIGTAGSITLVLQALIPAVSISGNRLEMELVGGTDVKWSPTLDYMRYVVRPAFKAIGIEFSVSVEKRGYYPIGGGVVHVSIEPCAGVKALDLLSAPRLDARIVSVCSNLPRHVAERQVAGALVRLEREGVVCAHRSVSLEPAASPGSSILVYCSSGGSSGSDYGPFIGGDAIGEKGKRAEEVGASAASKFLESYISNATVDTNLADMLVLPLSLADGKSRYTVSSVSQHLDTNLYIASRITSCRYNIEKDTNGLGVYQVVIEPVR
ncbi:MAG: RNA 3'-terminal phosphate cyclase [Candidatus Nitrosocaldus sp.]